MLDQVRVDLIVWNKHKKYNSFWPLSNLVAVPMLLAHRLTGLRQLQRQMQMLLLLLALLLLARIQVHCRAILLPYCRWHKANQAEIKNRNVWSTKFEEKKNCKEPCSNCIATMYTNDEMIVRIFFLYNTHRKINWGVLAEDGQAIRLLCHLLVKHSCFVVRLKKQRLEIVDHQ